MPSGEQETPRRAADPVAFAASLQFGATDGDITATSGSSVPHSPPSAQTRDTTLGHPGTLTLLRTNFPEPLKQSAVDFTSFAGNKRSGHPGTFSLAFLQTATTPHVFVSRELFSISLDNCKDNFWMLKLHLLLCCDTQLLSDYKLIPSRK